MPTPDIMRYGSYIACAHFVFVAFVIAFVLTTKDRRKRAPPAKQPTGASAPVTPIINDMGAFAFPIDKSHDYMRIWTPKKRVFAAT